MKRFLYCSIVCTVYAVLLCGCTGVEAEKRAYPQVIAVDVTDEGYEVIYGMPNMNQITGQDKSGSSAEPSTLVFKGRNIASIKREYNRTQEKYMDLGHVQVLILGDAIAQNHLWEQVFSSLKRDSSIGEDIYLFRTADIGQVMEYNGTKTNSLGNYLVGIYENRPYMQGGKGVTLRQAYKTWFESGDLCELPQIKIQEQEYLEIIQ